MEWIFFINVPIGLFAVGVVAQQIKGRPEKTEKSKMDYMGLAMLVLGVGFNLDVDFTHLAMLQLIQGFGVATFFMIIVFLWFAKPPFGTR